MMDQTPDLDELARRYLNLWQEHLSALGAEGEMAEAVAKSIELMNASAVSFAQMAKAGSPQARDNNHDQAPPGTSPQASGAASLGPALKHPDPVLDQLARRIAELEERIAELESNPNKDSE